MPHQGVTYQTMQHYTIIDFCWGRHELLLNSKLHTEQCEAEVNMNCLLYNNTTCSPKRKSTIVLLIQSIFQLKGLSFRRYKPNFIDVTSQTMRHYDVTSQTMRHYLKWRHHPCDIRALCHKPCGIIQLLTFIEVDMKCYWTVNFILAYTKWRSIWIVYCSMTLHVHRNKSQQLFYYIKSIFQLKSLLFSRFNARFGWRYFTNHATLRRYVTDYATLLEATSSSMRH